MTRSAVAVDRAIERQLKPWKNLAKAEVDEPADEPADDAAQREHAGAKGPHRSWR